MKKLGLLLVGGIAAIVMVNNLGPLVGLAFSLVILYYAVKGFLKTDSIFKKVLWAGIGFVVLMATASNIPAIFAIVAAYVLYVVYKKWNETKFEVEEEKDPFINFEKQWAELKR